MAWYSRKEIAELEGDIREGLGNLLEHYHLVLQTSETLDKIIKARAISDDEAILELIKKDGFNDLHDLGDYRYFNPFLAVYLEQGNRLTLAREVGWNSSLTQTNERANFRKLGLYPKQIRQMVKFANKCEIQYKNYLGVRYPNENQEVYLVDTESKDFPQIVKGQVCRQYPFTIGPGIWTPLEEIIGPK